MIIFITIYIALCYGVGSVGSGRKIGFFSAFIFALLFSPLIGWLITLAYPKVKNEQQNSPYNNLMRSAITAYNKGNYTASINILKDAILKYPSAPEAYLRLGAVYANMGDINLAMKNVAKAKSLGIKSLDLLNRGPFDRIRSNKEWIEFVENEYQLTKSVEKQYSSVADELIKLGDLLEKRLITQEEFLDQKKKLLEK